MYERLQSMVEKNHDIGIVVDFIGSENVSYKYYATIFHKGSKESLLSIPGCSIENALKSLDRYIEIHNL